MANPAWRKFVPTLTRWYGCWPPTLTSMRPTQNINSTTYTTSYVSVNKKQKTFEFYVEHWSLRSLQPQTKVALKYKTSYTKRTWNKNNTIIFVVFFHIIRANCWTISFSPMAMCKCHSIYSSSDAYRWESICGHNSICKAKTFHRHHVTTYTTRLKNLATECNRWLARHLSRCL